MNFRDYRWFKNPRGLHNNGAMTSMYIDRYINAHMGWAKMAAASDEYLRFVRPLVNQGCMPIVRIYYGPKGTPPMPPDWDRLMQAYIGEGALWFELYNEPNQPVEWEQTTGVDLTYRNVNGLIGPMMSNWLAWAERVIQLGGYPGFPALTETADDPNLATTNWLEAMFRYLRDNLHDRFVRVAANGAWFATHPYVFNHWYQQPRGGPAYRARPPEALNAGEGGWHFEYPYDPLQQEDDPGRTVFGGTALSPNGDPNGLLNTGEACQQLLKKYFNIGPLPVVGTEGGIDVPKDNRPLQLDDRYPSYDLKSHAEATLAMFEWIATVGPPWMFGVTLWLEDDYFFGDGSPIPAIQRLDNTAPLLKDVPSIDTASGSVYRIIGDHHNAAGPGGPAAPAPGPGPITGSPDYHWMILAPGLQADWFFTAARAYWQTFRPTVLTSWRLIRTIPSSKSMAVTVLARSDTIGYLNRRVRDVWPNLYYDAIVFDTLEEMQAELDRRADTLKRFGG